MKPGAPSYVEKSRGQQFSDAITELDLERAKQLLEDLPEASQALSLERARLSLYAGDCDSAEAILAMPSLHENEEGRELYRVARGCARATAGGKVVEDKKRGLWIRLQDHRDEALVPFIQSVAERARASLTEELGVMLPRPLRIDLVRDLFSLAAVSGLPVQAAETTGTVAVARWGRVIMITPRATSRGYPWQDTLAHELAHLVLSRASRDRAPLWLQEGIAKRQEDRWRKPRPGDDLPDADQMAYHALVTGRSVGIDKIGPSIAMLPTPEAASIAYAEVFSFMNYWLRENGAPALELLLLDLREVKEKEAEKVMRTVTGYSLSDWKLRWQADLVERFSGQDKNITADPLHAPPEGNPKNPQLLARWLRLGQLLSSHDFPRAASVPLGKSHDEVPQNPAVRYEQAQALLLSERPESARTVLGGAEGLTVVHGGWYALHGRFLREQGNTAGAEAAFELAAGVDPLAIEVACRGHFPNKSPKADAVMPKDPIWARLCEAALEMPRDGAPGETQGAD